jgi:hypothetical protein
MDDAHAQLIFYFEFRSDCNNNNSFLFWDTFVMISKALDKSNYIFVVSSHFNVWWTSYAGPKPTHVNSSMLL